MTMPIPIPADFAAPVGAPAVSMEDNPFRDKVAQLHAKDGLHLRPEAEILAELGTPIRSLAVAEALGEAGYTIADWFTGMTREPTVINGSRPVPVFIAQAGGGAQGGGAMGYAARVKKLIEDHGGDISGMSRTDFLAELGMRSLPAALRGGLIENGYAEVNTDFKAEGSTENRRLRLIVKLTDEQRDHLLGKDPAENDEAAPAE